MDEMVDDGATGVLDGERAVAKDDPELRRSRSKMTEEVFQAGDAAADAAAVAMAKVLSASQAAASNGNTLKAKIEVDFAVQDQFAELLGESTFQVRYGVPDIDNPETLKIGSFGEVRVLSVATGVDTDNVPRTKVVMQWDAGQLKQAILFATLMGQVGRIEFHRVQLAMFGEKV